MRFKALLVSTIFVFSLLSGICLAQNNVKVAVVPLIDEVRCECQGVLSSGDRWCDQGDGTVLDMTNCLVWLKNASWGGQKMWRNESSYDDAHTRAGILSAANNPGLSDSSVAGDWRLPTKTELYNLANGTEAVRQSAPRFFTGVMLNYWSSNTYEDTPLVAWNVVMDDGTNSTAFKTTNMYVWPVRSGN